MDTIILLISACLFALLFNFIFYKLNASFGLFVPIQDKIAHLNEKKQGKPLKIAYAIILIIVLVTPYNKVNAILQGVFYGLLFSLKDICFKNTFIERISNNESVEK